MIIGISGRYGSGKDTVAEFLTEQHGFIHFSLSDIIRDELKKRKQKLTRTNMIRVGNELRSNFGNSILANRILKKLEQNKNYVLSSIRSSAELDILKQRQDFLFVNIHSPISIRLKRIQSRKRIGDPISLSELKSREKSEESNDPAKQQLHLMERRAEVTILNNSTLNVLKKKINRMLKDWMPKKKIKRPNWDSYFIGINREVSKRGTCNRGRASCVIVKDKRILATGYAGAPHGMPHCDEEGHLMHQVINRDGSTSNHCIRTAHAEQNAIAQAAKHGIAIDGATIYVNMEPCFICAKIVVNAGIKRVVCEKRYHRAQLSRDLFKRAGIVLDVMSDELEQYSNQ